MVELCEKSYYAGELCKKSNEKYISVSPEFFWYPNQGSEPLEEGYWQNCWKNDGDEKDATTLTSPVDAEYQVQWLLIASVSLFSGGENLLIRVGHKDLEAADPFATFWRWK